MHSRVEDTRTLSLTILRRILTFLYADFLEADESISIGEHHCSLLHPCVSISTSTPFKPIYTFRLIASQWNKVFLSMARLDRYGSHQIVQGPRNYHTIIYTSLRKSVILGRYRVFHTLDTEHDYRGVFVAYDFGVTGGCKESTEVIIKAWVRYDSQDLRIESKVYNILSASPIKGFPSLIEYNEESNPRVFALVLEKLGPSLEELCRLMPHGRFDEKMTLALAIQMIDRYAALHTKKIIHNGAKPGNICLASLSSSATDASTLNVIDFGCSSLFARRLRLGEELSGNKRFLSAHSYNGLTQSQRDDLESLGYLLAAVYQGSLPWDSAEDFWEIWRIKMSTPGSLLFHGMDPSFLEYWRDVRTLAFGEVPDYCSLKSRFEQCWERNGFGNLPGEYDWLALFKRLEGGAEEKESSASLDKPLEISPLSAASAMPFGPISNPSYSAH